MPKGFCSSQPNKSNLVRELPNFLDTAKNGDYTVVFVSGHGTVIENEYYIVPADGDPDMPDTLVSWSQVKNWLTSQTLGKRIVLLDTCFSGAAHEDRYQRGRRVQQMTEDGIYVLSAAAKDAKAYESNKYGNGVFTYTGGEDWTEKQSLIQMAWFSSRNWQYMLA